MRRPASAFIAIFALCVVLSLSARTAPGAAQQVDDGLIVPVGSAALKVEVCSEDVIRVAYAPDRAFFDRASIVTAPRRCGGARFDVATSGEQATLSTARLKVRVHLATGAVTFLDSSGTELLAEASRSMTPAEVQGERTFHVQQRWSDADESLYGLGQHQFGLMNIKGYDLDLWQHNTTVAVPVLVSSRGYGVLWDNLSFTRFGDLREAEPMPAVVLRDATGKPGGLTGHYFAGAHFDREVATRVDSNILIEVPGGTKSPNSRIHPALPPEGDVSVRWEGSIAPATTGDYTFQTYTNSGFKMWIDERLVIDHWRQGWLPWRDVARAHLVSGRSHKVKIEWSKDQGVETCQVRWKPPSPSSDTSLWSEVGEGIDYYFFYGPTIDNVIAGYRRVTGAAPMMPRWAFGLWQSRERYKTQQESLDVLDGFRRRRIPIDVIVQDWQYWKLDSWGSHEFEAARFPDPDRWIGQIHDRYNARLMISIWGKYYPGTSNFEAMHKAGFLFEPPLERKLKDWLGFPYTFFDPFGPAARQMFWDQVNTALFRRGVDAWWMDATEPDLEQPMPTLEGQRALANPTAAGSGARVLNGYALATSQSLYEGQRATRPDQRVFILTRSAFAGQQRYAAATWSGDITSTWTALRRQIPAGLSFSISGLPYWTTDTGGFSVPPWFASTPQSPETADEWKELNVRWFQYSTFCPLLRVHGQPPNREMWFLGGESDPAYQAELKFDRLRYRLLPYIYSLAGAVTHESGSILRPLVMDFASDPQARDRGDEYMFGPAFLVAPVTEYKARSRRVHLPGGSQWYDFWSGRPLEGGQTIDAPAPYDALPVYLRAGAIVPFGPELQYTNEAPSNPITLFVYTGRDGRFTLYEDDGVSNAYERGALARIPLTWTEHTGTLTIGTRDGSYPGMAAEREFRVVFVSATRSVGYDPSASGQSVSYRGEAVTVQLNSVAASQIKVDQAGYLPDAPKTAFVVSANAPGPFAVVDADSKAVFRGTLGGAVDDPDSGDRVRSADFSTVRTPGTYTLDVDGVGRSWPFRIEPDLYRRAYYLAMRSYYGQRCGTAVDLGKAFPGYAHAACHRDGAFHRSSGTSGAHAVLRGWHDAGDYGRYVVNSGITTGTLLWTWELFGDRIKDIALDLPESGDRVPDILDEIRWNLDWMLSMQDRDGGVWHKQTSEKFPPFEMPEDDATTSYVIGSGAEPFKTTCATADLAAVAAIAARVYRPFDPAYADRSSRAAATAWEWTVAHPDAVFRNPPGVATGEYGDRNCGDEMLWASAELWRTTHEAKYERYFLAHEGQFRDTLRPTGPPSWPTVAPLALWTYALDRTATGEAATAIRTASTAASDAIVARTAAHAYRISMVRSDFVWGSNAVAANYGVQLLVANAIAPKRAFVDAALDNLHYLLGRNTFSLSWVTGVGANPFRHPHHRPSGADGNAEPWPGLLAGGPNARKQDPAMQKLPDLPPAKMYLDEQDSYASNEIAINWNAPLVFLLAAVQSSHSM